MSEPAAVPAVHGQYEDLGIAIVNLIAKIVEGQSPEIRARLWEGYLKDMDAWRAFWGR
jgi:hypothetical protein